VLGLVLGEVHFITRSFVKRSFFRMDFFAKKPTLGAHDGARIEHPPFDLLYPSFAFNTTTNYSVALFLPSTNKRVF
jgi:hypothetical protein